MHVSIRRAAGGILPMLVLGLGMGCAGPQMVLLSDVRATLSSADYRHAYDLYANAGKPGDAVDKLLNLGLLAFEAGDHEAAQDALARAGALADERLTKSVTQEVLGLAISDRVRPYPGTAFDLAMLHYYRALAFLAAGDREAAVVEGRAIAHHLEVTSRQSQRSYKDDAFLQWFSGALYQSAGQVNDAWVSYRRAHTLYAARDSAAIPSFLCPLERAAAAAAGVPTDSVRDAGCIAAAPRPADWGRVVVLCETGQAPPLLETNLVIPFLKTDRREWKRDADYLDSAAVLHARGPGYAYEETNLEYLLRIALPYYPPPAPPRIARVAVLGTPHGELQADFVQDVGAVLRQDFRDREPSIVVRAIARALLKYAATETVENKTDKRKDWTKDALPWLVNMAGVLSESADTRSWETLPDRIYAADVALPPGEHRLSAVFEDPDGHTVLHFEFPAVQVRAGETLFLRARCPDAGGTAAP